MRRVKCKVEKEIRKYWYEHVNSVNYNGVPRRVMKKAHQLIQREKFPN